MTIAAVEVGHYRIPLPVVLSDSTHGEITHFELVTARVRTADGAEGLGYTYTVGVGGAAIRSLARGSRAAARRARTPSGSRPSGSGCGGAPTTWGGAASRPSRSRRRTPRSGTSARGGAGSRSGRSSAATIPGSRRTPGGIDLLFPLDRLLRQTDDNLAKGFRAIKMKVGRPRLREDVERVRAMRERLGPDIPLMVDANMRWTADEAIRASRALADHDVFWLEEPTIPDDLPGHVRIVREGALPVAAGENLRTVHDFKRFIDAGGVSFPEPDVSNVGGVTAWLKVAHVAEAHNLPVTSHGVHDLHVHLLAAVPNASYLEVHGFGLERFIAHPLELRDGEAIAPDRPGHGVELDWKGLEPLRVK